MSMKDTIQDALDDIISPSASSNRRSRALAVLEQQLALACAPDVEDDTMRHFLELQDMFECNVPSRTFSWVQMTASRVEALAGKTSSDNRETELNAICSQLYQLLSVIQGITLHHTASKVYLGRRYPLEVLVALLTTSRHTSMITQSSIGSSTASLSSDKTSSIAHLSSAILDTLLCVLVDSSAALRMFEDVNGVQAVVKLLKRAGTPREVRMKCLEFLYFYLMDETSHNVSGAPSLGSQSTPSTPVTTQVHTSTRILGPRIFARPASTSSSSFSSSSSSSSSKSALSVATCSSQSSVQSIRTPSPVKKSYSTPMNVSDLSTPPNSPPPVRDGGRKTPRAVSTRSMMMLRRDVDYEPQSPKKGHGSRVYVSEDFSTPRVREKEADGSEGQDWESGHEQVRTTEEKKEILGTLLGNVDAIPILTSKYETSQVRFQYQYGPSSFSSLLPFALMKYSHFDRSASVATAFIGAVSNIALAAYLFDVWRSLAWEPGSEWEGLRFSLSRDGARLICGLFSAYFAAASAICVFGLVGIIKCIPSFVRIYRKYVIGDFAFCTLFAVLASSAAVDPAARAQVCEQVSRQPDLLRGVIDLGLTLENCEQWFERGLVAFMAVFLIRTIVRIHFIFALSRFYTRLASGHRCDPLCSHDDDNSTPLEHIYLLPHPSVDRNEKRVSANEASTQSPIYAPVPLAQVSPEMAHQLRATATEAWISRTPLPYHTLARAPSCDAGNEHTLRSPPSVGPIHLKDENS
ncbi:cell division control protein 14, SIN component-domain-containing protein [Lanmaoa asiatica]|nr:cell division control protein 14, SIN component-domain-containing protein [Lanmaoa asiatica]